MKERAFDYVKILKLPPKPRKSGIIEIRSPYYASSTTLVYAKSILNDWSDYFDGYKFACGTQRIIPKDTLKAIIKECHDHDIYVSTGGFVERVIAEGPKAVDRYIEDCKHLGFDVIEVSSGLAPIPLHDKIEIVKSVQKAGLDPKPEVTMMIGAGAGTHTADYKKKMKSEMRDVKDFINEAKLMIKLGAPVLMLESEGIYEDLPYSEWKLDILWKVIKETGYKKWMFEAADPVVFKWYLQNVAKDVNLFIDHSQLGEFNAWRLGVWGDPAIWKGKKVRYP